MIDLVLKQLIEVKQKIDNSRNPIETFWIDGKELNPLFTELGRLYFEIKTECPYCKIWGCINCEDGG